MYIQQILGNCSPLSQSTSRRPPNTVSISTKCCGSATTSPIIAASRPSGWACITASKVSANAAGQMASNLPSLAT
jgi:N6-adenosine-specific RNA methylase IME4